MAKKVVEAFQSEPDFCPECGSIMPLLGASEDVVTCRQCAFQKNASDYEELEIHSRKIFNVRKDRPTVSSSNTSEDLMGPMVDKKCPNCGGEGMTYQTRQTRSADEGQTVFYTCPKCKFKEMEYS